ncbi:MAG: DUF2062 domain-containing protein [Bacteroidales bacterium]
MKRIIHKQLFKPLLVFLKQGMTAHKIALTLSLGLTVGIMPTLGTSWILLVIAVMFRLNVLALQVVHIAITGIQLALFVPFLKMGQILFNLPNLPFELNNIMHLLRYDFPDTFVHVWRVYISGLFVWLVIAIPAGIGVYKLSLPYFRRYKRKMELKAR